MQSRQHALRAYCSNIYTVGGFENRQCANFTTVLTMFGVENSEISTTDLSPGLSNFWLTVVCKKVHKIGLYG